MKVAVFPSRLMGGDVTCWYCQHQRAFVLEYGVEYCTPDGWHSAKATCAYPAGDSKQVQAMLLDAIDLARKPLQDRS